MSVLLNFRCPCGYEEAIGVEPTCGVILEGAVTIICPKCGNITRTDNVRAMTPCRFQHLLQKPKDEQP
jgi:hypothetical protein